jgi:hypothetical protein
MKNIQKDDDGYQKLALQAAELYFGKKDIQVLFKAEATIKPLVKTGWKSTIRLHDMNGAVDRLGIHFTDSPQGKQPLKYNKHDSLEGNFISVRTIDFQSSLHWFIEYRFGKEQGIAVVNPTTLKIKEINTRTLEIPERFEVFLKERFKELQDLEKKGRTTFQAKPASKNAKPNDKPKRQILDLDY